MGEAPGRLWGDSAPWLLPTAVWGGECDHGVCDDHETRRLTPGFLIIE